MCRCFRLFCWGGASMCDKLKGLWQLGPCHQIDTWRYIEGVLLSGRLMGIALYIEHMEHLFKSLTQLTVHCKLQTGTPLLPAIVTSVPKAGCECAM
jgi:hypothetical protein